jgi:prophage DNA circulation protein
MGSPDLGTAAGFGIATLSGASGLLNQITGLNVEEWDIQESAYGHPPGQMVVFHVFKSKQPHQGAVAQVVDTIGRRVVPFVFPYVDGQTTDDLGRLGESFDFDILLFGPNYYAAFVALLKEFNNPVPGTLIHPVRGRFIAKFDGGMVTYHNASRQAVAIKAKFIEHNFDSSFTAPKLTTKSTLASAVSFIASIANVVNSIQSNIFVAKNFAAQAAALVGSYGSSYQSSLVALNTTFNAGTSADIPGLLPVNSSPSAAFPSATAPTDPFANLTPAQIQAQQSQVLSPAQATNLVNTLRAQATATIETLEAGSGGQGALIFYDEIKTLKQSALAVQDVLTLGLQSSNATVKNYTVPMLMGLREVCFENGLIPDRAYELELLNPQLLSTNYIEEGTVLQVPTS